MPRPDNASTYPGNDLGQIAEPKQPAEAEPSADRRCCRHARYLIAVLVVALGVRLTAAAVWDQRIAGPDSFSFGDSLSYWELGQRIAADEPYRYGNAYVFRTPGYPLLLAGMFKVLGNDAAHIWGRALGACCGTAAVGLVYALTCRLFHPTAALLVAAVAAVYPGAIASSVFILSEAPFCPLMLGQLLLMTVAWQCRTSSASGGWSVAAGVVAGVATLMRPSWLLFTPLAAVAMLLIPGVPNRARRWALPTAMLLGLVVVMAPWWLRNYQLSGHFIATTLQAGESLYDGLNPQADGSSDLPTVNIFKQQLRGELGPDVVADGLPAESVAGIVELEYRTDRALGDAAIDWASEHPGRAIQLAGVKLLRIWNVWPNEPSFRQLPVMLVFTITYVPVLLAAWLGIWAFTRRGWPYVLCWLPAVYFTALHVVFVSSIRYRDPAMLALIVLAAGFVCYRNADESMADQTSLLTRTT
jgi:4-amino-4-deoxy-L-arabinose transferase-like glycosyltransferase